MELTLKSEEESNTEKDSDLPVTSNSMSRLNTEIITENTHMVHDAKKSPESIAPEEMKPDWDAPRSVDSELLDTLVTYFLALD